MRPTISATGGPRVVNHRGWRWPLSFAGLILVERYIAGRCRRRGSVGRGLAAPGAAGRDRGRDRGRSPRPGPGARPPELMSNLRRLPAVRAWFQSEHYRNFERAGARHRGGPGSETARAARRPVRRRGGAGLETRSGRRDRPATGAGLAAWSGARSRFAGTVDRGVNTSQRESGHELDRVADQTRAADDLPRPRVPRARPAGSPSGTSATRMAPSPSPTRRP